VNSQIARVSKSVANCLAADWQRKTHGTCKLRELHNAPGLPCDSFPRVRRNGSTHELGLNAFRDRRFGRRASVDNTLSIPTVEMRGLSVLQKFDRCGNAITMRRAGECGAELLGRGGRLSSVADNRDPHFDGSGVLDPDALGSRIDKRLRHFTVLLVSD
jgi:hypothetical protein